MARKQIRLYLEEKLEKGISFTLDQDRAHYLATVMRLKIGQTLRVFSSQSGEWQAKIHELDRKKALIRIEVQLLSPVQSPFLGLAFPPLRSNRLSFLIEKATELGVTHFYPVITEYTQQKLPDLKRLESLAIEASEQSERLDVPFFAEPQKLSFLLTTLEEKRALNNTFPLTPIIGDERRQGKPLTTEQAQSWLNPLLIIGPEGGFSPYEFSALESVEGAKRVQLGSLILRAETAALAALAHFHSRIPPKGL